MAKREEFEAEVAIDPRLKQRLAKAARRRRRRFRNQISIQKHVFKYVRGWSRKTLAKPRKRILREAAREATAS
jgi:hypothetical protein